MDCMITWIGNCTGLVDIVLKACNLLIPSISWSSIFDTTLSGCIRVLNAIIQPAVNQLNDLAVQASVMAGKE
jgi:hypothetical protein